MSPWIGLERVRGYYAHLSLVAVAKQNKSEFMAEKSVCGNSPIYTRTYQLPRARFPTVRNFAAFGPNHDDDALMLTVDEELKR